MLGACGQFFEAGASKRDDSYMLAKGVTHLLTRVDLHTHTHTHTHTHILLPFDDHKPTGLKVDVVMEPLVQASQGLWDSSVAHQWFIDSYKLVELLVQPSSRDVGQFSGTSAV